MNNVMCNAVYYYRKKVAKKKTKIINGMYKREKYMYCLLVDLAIGKKNYYLTTRKKWLRNL